MSSRSNDLAQPADFEFAALDGANNYRAALLRSFQSYLQGNVLEVGAGIGQMTSELRQNPKIKKLLSIEPEARFCAQFRGRLPENDLLQGTSGDLQPGTAWNAILSVNVLEHIETDIQELAAYHRLLKPARGTLCLFVPARPEIYAPIDKDFGHFRRYTRRDLGRKLEQAGFEPLRLQYYNFAGYFGWWLHFCLLKRRTFDAGTVRLFDRVIFPMVHGLETRVCPPPIGQSLIAVAVAH